MRPLNLCYMQPTFHYPPNPHRMAHREPEKAVSNRGPIAIKEAICDTESVWMMMNAHLKRQLGET